MFAADGVGEEERVLEDDADRVRAGRASSRSRTSTPSSSTRPGVDVVEARHEAGDGGLAAAGRARPARPPPRPRSVRSRPCEHRAAAAVAERDALEADLARAPAAAAARRARRRSRGRSTRISSHATGRRRRARRLRDEHARHAQRQDEHEDVGVEGDEVADLRARRRAPGGRRTRGSRPARARAGSRGAGGTRRAAARRERRGRAPSSASRSSRRACSRSGPKPLTTRMPATLSSTTADRSPSFSCSCEADGLHALARTRRGDVEQRQRARARAAAAVTL